MFSKLVTVTAIVAVLASTVSADCSRPYTVQAQDTCDTICQNEHLSLFQLYHFNPLINADCSNLYPGESLCLAQAGKDCTDPYLHPVVDNDNCWSIYTNAKIDKDVFYANNGLSDEKCQYIYPGEVLCIAPKRIPY